MKNIHCPLKKKKKIRYRTSKIQVWKMAANGKWKMERRSNSTCTKCVYPDVIELVSRFLPLQKWHHGIPGGTKCIWNIIPLRVSTIHNSVQLACSWRVSAGRQTLTRGDSNYFCYYTYVLMHKTRRVHSNFISRGQYSLIRRITDIVFWKQYAQENTCTYSVRLHCLIVSFCEF